MTSTEFHRLRAYNYAQRFKPSSARPIISRRTSKNASKGIGTLFATGKGRISMQKIKWISWKG